MFELIASEIWKKSNQEEGWLKYYQIIYFIDTKYGTALKPDKLGKFFLN